ncbi:hypothetical protein [Bartonella grahamii]|uniref:Uncharacterized protein n=1 Tax=Bartonella grahamii TaxID=33045 RepID=A0A336NBE2_BARGR|nr:hypothetical protein [Bartonella grahamii]SSZ39390.1 Uncharacterised protein [Bartonella grahamii]
MPLGCGGRIDNSISIAKEKDGACFGANRWGNKKSLVGALLRKVVDVFRV